MLSSVDRNARLFDDGRWITGAELGERVQRAAETLRDRPRGLVFLYLGTDLASVVAYLATLASGHVGVLLDRKLSPAFRARLTAAYAPEVVWGHEADGYVVEERPEWGALAFSSASPAPMFDELALLLPTSGSTGSPKMVRLTQKNLEANARSIARSLGMDADDRAVSHLPFHYSYGLSVLNSHLLVGGSLVLTGRTFFEKEFWALCEETKVSTLNGVPYSFQMLERLGFLKNPLATVRKVTQAGGRLDPKAIQRFHEALSARGASFHVMYGQTEATARMSCLPPERLLEKLGGVGPAIADGRFEIVEDPESGQGEVVYHGPNVALGYAEARADLVRGDEWQGRLSTGDLGRLDDEGYLFLTGRRSRFAKVFGLRISLDEVEALCRPHAVIAVGRDDKLVLVRERTEPFEALEDLPREIAGKLGIHPSAVRQRVVDAVPRRSNGKVDYAALAEALAG